MLRRAPSLAILLGVLTARPTALTRGASGFANCSYADGVRANNASCHCGTVDCLTAKGTGLHCYKKENACRRFAPGSGPDCRRYQTNSLLACDSPGLCCAANISNSACSLEFCLLDDTNGKVMLVTGLTIALIFVLTACATFALTRAAPKRMGRKKRPRSTANGCRENGDVAIAIASNDPPPVIELTRRVSSEFSPNPVFGVKVADRELSGSTEPVLQDRNAKRPDAVIWWGENTLTSN